MKSDRSERRIRMGTLRPRYAFVLNPNRETRFTRCPRCEAKTRLRKLPLVIHVEGGGLAIVFKTCRLCVACDLLIAHQAEVEQEVGGALNRAIGGMDFVVLGTVDRQVWRHGLSRPLSLDAIKAHMSDFEAYLRVETIPGGWYQTNETG